jgi:hypothetical protein|nr:MAG TPA: hypothetical protein [Caudoviricetes sp.]
MKTTELPQRFQPLLISIKDALLYTGFNPAELTVEKTDNGCGDKYGARYDDYIISHKEAELELHLYDEDLFDAMYIQWGNGKRQITMYELQQRLKATKVTQHLKFHSSFTNPKVRVDDFVESLLSYDLKNWIIKLDFGHKGIVATFISGASGRQESMLANLEGKLYYVSYKGNDGKEIKVETLEEGFEALLGHADKKEHKRTVDFVLKAIEVGNVAVAGKATGLSFYLYEDANVVDMGLAFMSELLPPLTIIEPSVTVHISELFRQPTDPEIASQYDLLLNEGRQVILDVLLSEEAKAKAREEAKQEEHKSIIIH